MQSKDLPTEYFLYESKVCKYIFGNNKTLHLFFHLNDPHFNRDNDCENVTELDNSNVRYLSKKEIVLYKLKGYI